LWHLRFHSINQGTQDFTSWYLDNCYVPMQCIWQHFAPIFIGNYHFLNNFFYILVCCFYYSIHLRLIKRGIKMFNFPSSTQILNYLAIKILSIVNYKGFWKTISTNNVFLDKSSIRSRFNPFCKIINCYQDKPMSITRL